MKIIDILIVHWHLNFLSFSRRVTCQLLTFSIVGHPYYFQMSRTVTSTCRVLPQRHRKYNRIDSLLRILYRFHGIYFIIYWNLIWHTFIFKALDFWHISSVTTVSEQLKLFNLIKLIGKEKKKHSLQSYFPLTDTTDELLPRSVTYSFATKKTVC